MTVSNLPHADVGEVHFGDEASFAELAQTFTYRIPVLDVRPDFASGRASDMSRQARFAESRPGYRTERSASVEIDMDLAGAQADTATGALAATAGHELLASVLGGSDLTAVGGVAGATATTTAMPNITGTPVRGAIVHVGIKGDGGGDGQAAVIGNVTGGVLLSAMPAAPAAGAVVRANLMAYLADGVLRTSKRWMVGWSASGEQYGFHGCQPENATIRIAPGTVPGITIRSLAAYWRELSGFTVPSASTLVSCNSAISAGGSIVLAATGSTTRTLAEDGEIEITLNFGLDAWRGQGGVSGLQPITGWNRSKTAREVGMVRLRVAKEQAYQLSYDKDGSDSDHYQMLATLSAGEGTASTEGRHVAIYCPRMYFMGRRPSPVAHNGVLAEDLFFAMREGTDTTSALTRSALRIGLS